jgi:hypothetical protein
MAGHFGTEQKKKGGIVGRYFLPILVGNIIDEVASVAVGAHAEFFEADADKRGFR